MHPRLSIHRCLTAGLKVGAALALVVGASLVTAGPPAAAQDGPGAGPCATCTGAVTPTPEGLLAQARSEMAELNSVANDPPPCTDESNDYVGTEDGANDGTVQHEGYLQYRLTAVAQEDWDAAYGGDDSSTFYRLECFLPGVSSPWGLLVDVVEFQAVNPQVLAQVAIDDALALIPTQTVRRSPSGRSLVGVPTWFWVDGADDVVAATASVPGMSVTATASPGAVRFDLGDGTTMECAGRGTPYEAGATSDCTHTYERAGHYTVTSTILWTGTYTVNDAGPFPIANAVARTATLPDLPVNEAQAINTGGG